MFPIIHDYYVIVLNDLIDSYLYTHFRTKKLVPPSPIQKLEVCTHLYLALHHRDECTILRVIKVFYAGYTGHNSLGGVECYVVIVKRA